MLNVLKIFFVAVVLCLFSCSSQKVENVKQEGNIAKFKDGLYRGSLEKDNESYSTHAVVKINNGRVTSVDWKILDNNRNRYFDSTYEEVYKGNDLYIQQCRDNMIGMKKFGPELKNRI